MEVLGQAPTMGDEVLGCLAAVAMVEALAQTAAAAVAALEEARGWEAAAEDGLLGHPAALAIPVLAREATVAAEDAQTRVLGQRRRHWATQCLQELNHGATQLWRRQQRLWLGQPRQRRRRWLGKLSMGRAVYVLKLHDLSNAEGHHGNLLREDL
ncbi:UNVERIFIED_CONTAM: hypothetical protein K2H54_054505 [Gekko kuhli]